MVPFRKFLRICGAPPETLSNKAKAISADLLDCKLYKFSYIKDKSGHNSDKFSHTEGFFLSVLVKFQVLLPS